jgi:hypothetical protein
VGELQNIEEIRSVVRNSFAPETYRPNQSTSYAWDAAYEKYLKLLI